MISLQYTHILIRPGEIFLKGKNLPLFERALEQNIKAITSISPVMRLRGRFILPYSTHHAALRRVFGITSYSPAIKVGKNLDAIKAGLLELVAGRTGTFKIEPKRSDKSFPLTSPELNIELGRFLEAKTTLQFSREHPQHLFGVEINQSGAYLFDQIIPCFGGLPTGVEGKVLLLLEDEASVLAGLLFMKRGCSIYPVSIGGWKDIVLLQKFSPQKLKLMELSSLAEVGSFIKKNNLTALVSGQTLKNLQEYLISVPVFRPLVGYSEEKVKIVLEEFGEDCV